MRKRKKETFCNKMNKKRNFISTTGQKINEFFLQAKFV